MPYIFSQQIGAIQKRERLEQQIVFVIKQHASNAYADLLKNPPSDGEIGLKWEWSRLLNQYEGLLKSQITKFRDVEHAGLKTNLIPDTFYQTIREDLIRRGVISATITTAQATGQSGFNGFLQEMGRHGGKHPKKKEPILEAVIQYLQSDLSRFDRKNSEIAEHFLIACKNKEITVNVKERYYKVYFYDDLVIFQDDVTGNLKSIKKITFTNHSYIAEAKKIMIERKIA